jgi:hypothetical protein
MAKKADEGWLNKNGKPSRIPPYKAPRQTRYEGRGQTRQGARVEHVTETEDKGNGTTESDDSEEETQFGVVWEKFIIPETEEQEGQIDEVHIPSIETDATKKGFTVEIETDATKNGFTVEIEEIPTGDACVGKFVMKRFEQGLFKGTITTATKKRGRYLYHVLYEDGDSEDLDETEFSEAYELLLVDLLKALLSCIRRITPLLIKKGISMLG